MFDYIEMFYNPVRKHVRNGMLSPAQFERHCQVNGPRPSGAWKRRSYLSAVDAAFHSAIAAARNWRIVFREIR